VELVRLQGEVHAQRHPRSDVTVAQVLEQWLEVADRQATTGTVTTTSSVCI
jgi:hypothetical protein